MKNIPPHTCNACACILAERDNLRRRVAELEAELHRLQEDHSDTMPADRDHAEPGYADRDAGENDEPAA